MLTGHKYWMQMIMIKFDLISYNHRSLRQSNTAGAACFCFTIPIRRYPTICFFVSIVP